MKWTDDGELHEKWIRLILRALSSYMSHRIVQRTATQLQHQRTRRWGWCTCWKHDKPDGKGDRSPAAMSSTDVITFTPFGPDTCGRTEARSSVMACSDGALTTAHRQRACQTRYTASPGMMLTRGAVHEQRHVAKGQGILYGQQHVVNGRGILHEQRHVVNERGILHE
jgi:hypothetical protein